MLSPHDPFAIARSPASLERQERVALLLAAADALLRGDAPDRAAALFLGGALRAWLTEGGNLERDFLHVKAPRRCNPPILIHNNSGANRRRALPIPSEPAKDDRDREGLGLCQSFPKHGCEQV